LLGYPQGHPNSRLHGHSFRIEIGVAAPEPGTDGFVLQFDRIEAALKDVRAALDHGHLNEIEGLEQPTLERIAGWIAERLKGELPALSRVSIYRDSVGEACHLTIIANESHPSTGSG
jgi:6-pyruvoyltetrahydropterin/6-carboxytetrahydropterin synthase